VAVSGPSVAADLSAGGDRSTPRAPRLRSLDGLRGVAALMVLGFHVTLLNPAIARHLVDAGPAPGVWSAEWWLTETPLRILTAGDEAVFIFFVLSGLVLTLPILGAGTFDWLSFMAARVWRLFLPAAVSLILAFVLVKVWPREATTGGSAWLQLPYNPLSASWTDVLRGMDLVFTEPILNGPVWTLRWEMLFSLMLPLAVGIALVASRLPAWIGLVCLAGMMTGGLLLGLPALVYLPMFMLGVLLAVHLVALRQLLAAPDQRWPVAARIAPGLTIFLALVMLSTYLLVRPHVDDPGWAVLARVISIFGAALLVAVIAVALPHRGWLSGRLAQWLGKISFSLYLVHQPVLATAGFAFGSDRWILAGAVGGIASVAAAVVFWRLIERPSHNWSRWFGRRSSVLLRERIATSGQNNPVPASGDGR
jgi:peptidoglycan/LPS O-acetylase OafA/YrhL